MTIPTSTLKDRFIDAGLHRLKRVEMTMNSRRNALVMFGDKPIHNNTLRGWESLGWLEREHATSSLWFVRPVAEREGWEA